MVIFFCFGREKNSRMFVNCIESPLGLYLNLFNSFLIDSITTKPFERQLKTRVLQKFKMMVDVIYLENTQPAMTFINKSGTEPPFLCR